MRRLIIQFDLFMLPEDNDQVRNQMIRDKLDQTSDELPFLLSSTGKCNIVAGENDTPIGVITVE
jgi:hypothetical protein